MLQSKSSMVVSNSAADWTQNEEGFASLARGDSFVGLRLQISVAVKEVRDFLGGGGGAGKIRAENWWKKAWV